ncbi:hypothetical protein C8J57DRAFT_1542277 [Mycena rebaudengoi]|nr:hypothetical protein C8J57DRAFT_1542277 [Mycena rebaudengoi]
MSYVLLGRSSSVENVTDFSDTRGTRLFILFVSSAKIALDPYLTFTRADGEEVVLCLRGVVYHGGSHFTSRIVDSHGDVWFHDGITTRSTSVYEGNLGSISSLSGLHSHAGDSAILAIYAALGSAVSTTFVSGHSSETARLLRFSGHALYIRRAASASSLSATQAGTTTPKLPLVYPALLSHITLYRRGDAE